MKLVGDKVKLMFNLTRLLPQRPVRTDDPADVHVRNRFSVTLRSSDIDMSGVCVFLFLDLFT